MKPVAFFDLRNELGSGSIEHEEDSLHKPEGMEAFELPCGRRLATVCRDFVRRQAPPGDDSDVLDSAAGSRKWTAAWC